MKKRRISVVILLMGFLLFGSLAQADNIPQLDVPYFSQHNSLWSGEPTSGSNTIGGSGCMMTSFAMVLAYYGVNTNPKEFNDWLRAHDGYNINGLAWGTKVHDYAVDQGASNVAADLDSSDLIVGTNDQAIRNELSAGYPVIVKNEYGPTQQHWMVVVKEVNGIFYVLDPDETTSELVPISSGPMASGKYANYPYIKYLFIHGPTDYSTRNEFDFIGGSQKWVTGYDAEFLIWDQSDGTWKVNVTGSNPGVESPMFPANKFTARETLVGVTAKVSGTQTSSSIPMIYIRDETGSWNNPVTLTLMESSVDGGAPFDNQYHYYEADLSNLRADMKIVKFSIELTSESMPTDESWTFDNIKLTTIAQPVTDRTWNFTDSDMGWKLSGATFSQFLGGYTWCLDPASSTPSIISPNLGIVDGDYSMIGIRYSVNDPSGSGPELPTKVCFNIDNDVNSVCSNSANIVQDGGMHVVIFKIPEGIIGHVRKARFELFSDSSYVDQFIAIDKIAFLKGDGTDDPLFGNVISEAIASGSTETVVVVNSGIYVSPEFISEEINFVPIEESGETGSGGEPPPQSPTFDPPTGLSAVALGTNRVQTAWDDIPNIYSYIVSLTKVGSTDPNDTYTFYINDNSFLFSPYNSSLTANTQYELKVKAKYGPEATDESETTGGVFVTTFLSGTGNLTAAELLTCEDVVNKACVNPQNQFPYTPQSIYIYLALAELHPDPLLFRFDLYDPSGNLAQTYNYHGSFNFPELPWVTYTNMASDIQGVSNRSGQWRIEIHYGNDIYSINNFYTTHYFSVEEAPPPPAQVPWIETIVVW